MQKQLPTLRQSKLLKSRTLSVSILSDFHSVYTFASNPKNLPQWATTFIQSIRKVKGQWIAQTLNGLLAIKIVPKNLFGILDHYLSSPDGNVIFVPMRVVPNAKGCEVLFTVFRQPGMSHSSFVNDLRLVQKDLKSLKRMMEG